MAWRLVKIQVVKLTRNLIDKFVKMTPVYGDRGLSEERLRKHKRSFENGQMRSVNWVSIFVSETDQIYRVNGKHTSTLFANMEYVPDMLVILEEYEGDTKEDAAKLYSTYDSTVQTRTYRDVCRSFAGSNEALRHLPYRITELASGGISLFEANGSKSRTGHLLSTEKAEKILNNIGFCVWLDSIITSPKKKVGEELEREKGARYGRNLRRNSVIAAMYGSWKVDPEAATRFWTAVRDETGTSPLMQDRRLARFLNSIVVSMAGRSNNKAVAVSDHKVFSMCNKCWNKWRKGDMTSSNYDPEVEVPPFV